MKQSPNRDFPGTEIRRANQAEVPLLRHWDQQPRHIEANPNGDWESKTELRVSGSECFGHRPGFAEHLRQADASMSPKTPAVGAHASAALGLYPLRVQVMA